MKIPNYVETAAVDKDGKLTPVWRQIFTNLFKQMQGSLSDEGLKAPHQTTATINQLALQKNSGKILYDKDTKEFKVNIDGVIKTMSTV